MAAITSAPASPGSDASDLATLLWRCALAVTREDVDPETVVSHLGAAIVGGVYPGETDPAVRAAQDALLDGLARYRSRVTPLGWYAVIVVPLARALLPVGVTADHLARALLRPAPVDGTTTRMTAGEAAARHVLEHVDAWLRYFLPEESTPETTPETRPEAPPPAEMADAARCARSAAPREPVGFAGGRLPAPDDPVWASTAPA